MYEERYGTDWETLDTEEAIERAYALGVLAELGEGLPVEYERVREAVDPGPGADMVALAYEEGCAAVADIDAPGRSDRETWEELVGDAGGELTRGGDGPDEEDPPSSAPPSSLSALDPPDDDPGLLEFPEFLRRE